MTTRGAGGSPGSTFAHRYTAYALNIVGTWTDPVDDEANLAWVREAFVAVEPRTHGVYG